MIFIELTRVWRQSDDDFVACLNRVRRGEMSRADLDYLNAHCAPPAAPPASSAPPQASAHEPAATP
eukprot:3583264-Prymnesium_polylepis.1